MQPQAPYVLVLVTLPAEVDYRQLTTTILTQKLAAGVNMTPLLATRYIENGEIIESQERVLVFRTLADLAPKLAAALAELTGLPDVEIGEIEVKSHSASYSGWIKDSVQGE